MLLQPPHHCGLDVFVCAEHRQDLCFARAQKHARYMTKRPGCVEDGPATSSIWSTGCLWTVLATWDPELSCCMMAHVVGTPRPRLLMEVQKTAGSTVPPYSTMTLGFKFQLQPSTEGFWLLAPLNVFMTVRCTDVGNMWGIRGPCSASRPVVKGYSVKWL